MIYNDFGQIGIISSRKNVQHLTKLTSLLFKNSYIYKARFPDRKILKVLHHGDHSRIVGLHYD